LIITVQTDFLERELKFLFENRVFFFFVPSRSGKILSHGVLPSTLNMVPSAAKVLLSLIFSNLHNLGKERDTNEQDMHSIDISSIDLIDCFFVVSLPVFK